MRLPSPMGRAITYLKMVTNHLEHDLLCFLKAASERQNDDYYVRLRRNNDPYQDYQRGIGYGQAIALTELRRITATVEALHPALEAEVSDGDRDTGKEVTAAVWLIIRQVTAKGSCTDDLIEPPVDGSTEAQMFTAGQKVGYIRAIQDAELEMLRRLPFSKLPNPPNGEAVDKHANLVAFFGEHGITSP